MEGGQKEIPETKSWYSPTELSNSYGAGDGPPPAYSSLGYRRTIHAEKSTSDTQLQGDPSHPAYRQPEESSRFSTLTVPNLPEHVSMQRAEDGQWARSTVLPSREESIKSSSGLRGGYSQSTTNASDALSKGIKIPANVAMGVAKGFHNIPKLYGDQTVRESGKVTGIQSGLREAGKELGYGFYDGFTGLVTQPIKGAVYGGPAGAMKGLISGSMGVLIKPCAAATGLIGYSLKGVSKELEKRSKRSTGNEDSASLDSDASRTRHYDDDTSSGLRSHPPMSRSNPGSEIHEIAELHSNPSQPAIGELDGESVNTRPKRQAFIAELDSTPTLPKSIEAASYEKELSTSQHPPPVDHDYQCRLSRRSYSWSSAEDISVQKPENRSQHNSAVAAAPPDDPSSLTTESAPIRESHTPAISESPISPMNSVDLEKLQSSTSHSNPVSPCQDVVQLSANNKG